MLDERLNRNVICGTRYRNASLSILELSPSIAEDLIVLISDHILRTSFSFVIISGKSLFEKTP